MATTHLHDYLKIIAKETRRLLQDILPKLGGAGWWQTHVVDELTNEQKEDVRRKQLTSLEKLDLSALVQVLKRNWSEIAFKVGFPKGEKTLVEEILNIRNRVAHDAGEDAPLRDQHRDWDTIRRYLTLIRASREIIQSAEEQLRDLEKRMANECEGNAPSHAQGPYNLNMKTASPGQPTNVHLDAFRQAGFPPELDWMAKYHYSVVAELEKANIQVVRIMPVLSKYFIKYELAQAGHKAELQVFFNKKGELSPQKAQPVGFSESKVFAEECDRCLVRAYEAVDRAGIEFPEDPPELRELFDRYMKPAVEKLGGEILKVKHSRYRERYFCRSADEKMAVLDLCYDDKRKFKKKPEIQPGTTDEGFAQAIIGELKKL